MVEREQSSNQPEGLIAVRGTRFVLGEREIVPHGVNSYPLLQHAGDERWDAVDDIFAQAVVLGRPIPCCTRGGARPCRHALRSAVSRTLGAAVIRDRALLARRYGMPLLLEELGHPMPARMQGVARDRERAEVLRALLAVADELGIAAFPWMIGERGETTMVT